MKACEKFNVKSIGKGTSPLVFVHGFGCDQSMWRFITPVFEESHRILLLDLMGAGRSKHQFYDSNKYSKLEGYSEDIISICDELKLGNITLVGHSVGSMIGILAAIQRPDLFSQLVLIAPSPCYYNDGDYKGGFKYEELEAMLEIAHKDFLGWARSMAPAIMGRGDRPELGEELTNSFCSTNPEVAKQFAKVTFLSDSRESLPRLQVPSLILQCSQDIVAPDSVGEYLHKTLPDSTYTKLKAIGHCPHVSEPEETIQAIKSYLQRTPKTKSA